MRPSFKAVCFISALALTACSKNSEAPYIERSVEELYNTAMDHLEEGKFAKAAEAFDEVERQHPYPDWATKAQIMSGYAHYRGQKYERALPAFETFTQMHPAHSDVPYALYMTGLSYYEQIGPATRDQKDTESALRIFKELIRRFPTTAYAKDARAKVLLLNDALAGKEMEVGRYYLDQRAYQAAIYRFQSVIKKFDTTKHVEEALYRLVEAHKGLGLEAQAKQYAAVLGHNYSSSPWYYEAYRLVGGTLPKGAQGTFESLRDKEEGWFDRLRNWNKGPRKATPPIASAEEGSAKSAAPSEGPSAGPKAKTR